MSEFDNYRNGDISKLDSVQLSAKDIDDSVFNGKGAYPIDETYENTNINYQLGSLKKYKELYEQSIRDPQEFWGRLGSDSLRWMQKFTKVLAGDFKKGNVSWFINGKLNACDNCVDRWVETQPDKVAIIWEKDNPNESKKITYKKLLENTCRVANMLKYYGVKKQDTVTMYLPMIPELIYSMLACARIGAIHNVVFAGYSAESLSDRIKDSKSKILITSDFGLRGGKLTKLKEIADIAMNICGTIETCIVFKNKTRIPFTVHSGGIGGVGGRNISAEEDGLEELEENRNGQLIEDTDRKLSLGSMEFDPKICTLRKGRDIDGTALIKNMRPYCPIEYMDSEDFLCILYTSGSTGKPKGVAHTTAGYLLYAYVTCKYIFDVKEDDVFGCVADIGWVTGHSYVLYGPLLNGITTTIFSSIPTYPDCGRYWQLIQSHKITHFYTAPTALRALMKHGDHWVDKYDISSCRVLGSVGEPINPEAWRWYYNVIGKKKCAIVDTYWQTETGGIVIAPIAGITMLKPGCATLPFFGIELEIVDPKELSPMKGENVCGLLCIKSSWPGMLRTVFGNHNRLIKTYFGTCPNVYFTGDGAYRDQDGYYWIAGRIDDTLNVSGHRLGAAEIEHALMQHEAIVEAAVVALPHKVKGEGILCFVVRRNKPQMNNTNTKNDIIGISKEMQDNETLKEELKKEVRKYIGPIATPDLICIVPDLPKTRSGKVVRRILRSIGSGITDYGDITTVANYDIIEVIREIFEYCKHHSNM